MPTAIDNATLNEYVILVNEQDEEVGVCEKLQAHLDGVLHRAFSVFIFNDNGDLLLQQRHPGKYHSGGLWSNTCCSHPRPGELVEAAAHRRLQEEMGLACELEKLFGFVYHSQLGANLYEHEYDHVFVGRHNGTPVPDGKEVSSWRWVDATELQNDVAAYPDQYTYWFRLILDRVLQNHQSSHISAHNV